MISSWATFLRAKKVIFVIWCHKSSSSARTVLTQRMNGFWVLSCWIFENQDVSGLFWLVATGCDRLIVWSDLSKLLHPRNSLFQRYPVRHRDQQSRYRLAWDRGCTVIKRLRVFVNCWSSSWGFVATRFVGSIAVYSSPKVCWRFKVVFQ